MRYVRLLAAIVIVLPVAQPALAEPLTGAPDALADCPITVVRAYLADRAMVDRLAAWTEPWEVHHDKGYLVVGVDAAGWARLLAEGFQVEVDETLTRRYCHPAPPLEGQRSGIPGYPCYATVEETFAEAAGNGRRPPRPGDLVDVGDSWEKTTRRRPARLRPDGAQADQQRGRRGPRPGPPHPTASRASCSPRPSTPASTRPPSWPCASPRTCSTTTASTPTRPGCSTSTRSTSCSTSTRTAASSPRPGTCGARTPTTTTAALTPAPGAPTSTATSPTSGAAAAARQRPVRRDLPRAVGRLRAGDAGGAGLPARDLPGPAGPEPDRPGAGHRHRRLPRPAQLRRLSSLWPWGFTSTVAPNGTALQTLGRRSAYFNGYTPQQSIGLYPTDGTTIDFAYGDLGVASLHLRAERQLLRAVLQLRGHHPARQPAGAPLRGQGGAHPLPDPVRAAGDLGRQPGRAHRGAGDAGRGAGGGRRPAVQQLQRHRADPEHHRRRGLPRRPAVAATRRRRRSPWRRPTAASTPRPRRWWRRCRPPAWPTAATPCTSAARTRRAAGAR